MQTFALLGAGFIGTVHAKNLATHPQITFKTVCDNQSDRARDLAEKFGATWSGDPAEVFADPEIDAVLIATSTDTHSHYLRLAAKHNKAVFCEKPIDLSLDVAKQAANEVIASGIPAFVDFNRRFDQDYQQLRQAVKSGTLGNVELVQMTTRGPSLPPLDYLKVSGGQMRDQTVHFFDLLRWITDLDPINVHVMGSALVDPQVAEIGDVDASIATLTLPGGALCQIDSMRQIQYGYDERIEVCGSAGMMEAGRQRTGFVSHYTSGKVSQTGMHLGWFERMEPTYREALNQFVIDLENGKAPTPSVQDGLKAQAIAEAATKSLLTGTTVEICY